MLLNAYIIQISFSFKYFPQKENLFATAIHLFVHSFYTYFMSSNYKIKRYFNKLFRYKLLLHLKHMPECYMGYKIK